MSKLKLLSIAVIGLLIINLGVIGFLLLKKLPMLAMGMPEEKQKGPKKIIIDKLHFDKAQIIAYEALIAEHRKSVKALKDSIGDTKNKLYELLKTTSFDGKNSLVTLLGELQKKLELVHYHHFEEIKKLCKPEQLADFNKLTSELAFYFTAEKKPLPPPSNN